MLGTYYRVGFYGKLFGSRLDGNEFIYKMPKITRLMEIAGKMKGLYTKQLGKDVKILPDSGPVDVSKLDPQDCIIQVTFVSPHFDPEEKNIRETYVQQNNRLSAFKFSTPFTKTGKSHGDASEQHKRNTVLYVKDHFPSIQTAQKIFKRTETILSPIESAIEDIELRSERMNSECESTHINKKALSGILAGTVAPQVHGGAKEICQAFLSLRDDPSKTFDPKHQESLRKAMLKFLQACQRALDVNKGLCESDSDKEFQANLDTQFDEMCNVMQPLLTERKKKKEPKKGGAAVRFG